MHTNKNNLSENDDGNNGDGYTMPLNPTTEELISLSETIYFIGFCLQGLKHNVLERCNIFLKQ